MVNKNDTNGVQTAPHVALWDKCLAFLRDNVPAQSYTTWIEAIAPHKFDGASFVITVPSHYFYDFIEEHLAHYIKAALLKNTGRDIQLHYRIGEVALPSEQEQNVKPTKEEEKPFDSHLISHYTFSQFLEGESNRLSRATGLAVAANPGNTPFNPLFIYGQSGVGKTHLANAIGHEAKAQHPNLRVLYVSAHLFLVQYTTAVHDNAFNDFMSFYQSIDLLIIDDVQEFIGKTGTQNTLFHIFNHLHMNKKQLVFTSDREPALLQGMEDRLMNRFKWGMMAELQTPAYELRKKILQNKVARSGTRYPEEVVDYIARNVTSGIREIEGIATSLLAYSIQLSKEIDLELAQYVVKKIVKVDDAPITVDEIVKRVSSFYNIETRQIQSTSRKQAIVNARQVAMYLASKYTRCSTAQIGALIGKREHSTVIHSCNTVEKLRQVDRTFQADLEAIIATLGK